MVGQATYYRTVRWDGSSSEIRNRGNGGTFIDVDVKGRRAEGAQPSSIATVALSERRHPIGYISMVENRYVPNEEVTFLGNVLVDRVRYSHCFTPFNNEVEIYCCIESTNNTKKLKKQKTLLYRFAPFDNIGGHKRISL